MTNPIWRESAATTAARIAAGDLSASDAIDSALDRIAQVNGPLNAIVDDQANAARAAAEVLDAEFKTNGPVGPLHGLPVTIKVNVDQAGSATTNGIPALKDMVAGEDAPLVANLKRAGAIIVGRTNTPEFSFRADTDNPLHGRTYNPWNKAISPGGSSGGASSAVMSGMCALAHGNDIGGSLRFPAAQTGAATVKPGFGRVPAFNPSQVEERGMLAQAMSVQGIIARTVADVRLGTKAMIAPDHRDPFMAPVPWEGAPLEGPIKVAFTKEMFDFDLHPAVSAALDDAAAALREAGYEVVEVEPPHLRDMGVDGYRALMGEVQALLGPMIREHGSNTLNGIFNVYYEMFPPYEGDELLKVMAKRTFYAREWAKCLAEYPLFLTPFLPNPPFAANRDAEGWEGVKEVLGGALYSYSMNFIGQPAGNIAAGMHDGLPLNVQIVGRRWREDLILDACEAIEGRVGVMAEKLFERGLDV